MIQHLLTVHQFILKAFIEDIPGGLGLRLHIHTAGSAGSIPWPGTLRILMPCSVAKKKKAKTFILLYLLFYVYIFYLFYSCTVLDIGQAEK